MANAKAKQNPSTAKPRSFFKRLGIILGSLLLVFVTTCAIVDRKSTRLNSSH